MRTAKSLLNTPTTRFSGMSIPRLRAVPVGPACVTTPILFDLTACFKSLSNSACDLSVGSITHPGRGVISAAIGVANNNKTIRKRMIRLRQGAEAR